MPRKSRDLAMGHHANWLKWRGKVEFVGLGTIKTGILQVPGTRYTDVSSIVILRILKEKVGAAS
jgi:hypothetical protein